MDWNSFVDWMIPTALIGLWVDKKAAIARVEKKLEDKVSHSDLEAHKESDSQRFDHIKELLELIRDDIKEIKERRR